MTPASDCGSALLKWVSHGCDLSPKLANAFDATRGQGDNIDASQRPDFADMALGINLKDLNDLLGRRPLYR